MKSSNKIQHTKLDITQFICPRCQQDFTEEDNKKGNWEIFWDTSRMPKTEKLIVREGFYLTILVRSIEHKECPKK